VLKRPAILFACLAVAAVFVFGLVRLFELRLSQGDVYPAYSTLRSDPLGASVFYETLERLPGVSSQRFFEQTFKETDGRGRSYFVLGTQPFTMTSVSRPEFDALQQFASKGGRVVIAFYPEAAETWTTRLAQTNALKKAQKKSGQKGSSKTNSVTSTNVVAKTNVASTNNVSGTNSVSKKSKKPLGVDDDEGDPRLHFVDLKEEWAFGVGFSNLEKGDDGKVLFPEATLVAKSEDLPATMPVHTSLCFTNLNKAWSTIYQRDEKMPVVVERKFGDGAVILIADSYPFSNEAMFKDRYASLLTWVLGGTRDAIFDEAHLGVAETPGIASLMRRYRLEGLIFSLVLVAGLFIWKNSQSLVPRQPEVESDAGPVVMGRDSASGFINLVRRGVPSSKIIEICFKEWTDSVGRTVFPSPQQLVEVQRVIDEQAALEPRLRRPIETFRRISELLKRRK
jgi:hypothetical protein